MPIKISSSFLLRITILQTILWAMLQGCGQKKEFAQSEKIPAEPVFKLRKASETGVDFNNIITEDRNRNIIRYQGYYDGGGVAVADFNNDGLIDLYFTANIYPNKFYINKGNFRFEDQTEASGLKEVGFGWYTGVTVVDINNDGWMDLYVCKSGILKEENRRNLLYVNNGDATFTDRAAEYGLDHAGYSTHAAFFDYDRDGDLDMYLTNYGVLKGQFKDEETLRLRSESDEYNGDKLFENIDGKFVNVTRKAGLADHKFGFAHSVGIGDFNGDGWDDIYVCNDFFEADYLYLNQGNKTFRESLSNSMNHISNFSMGNDVADFNNDGFLDIMVLDMVAEDNRRMKENMSGMDAAAFNMFVSLGFHYQYMFNMLHMNNGNETFSEIAHLAGISNTDWSWAPLFADFDNDGFKDLYITNGLKRDARNLTAKYQFEETLRQTASERRSDLTDDEWNRAINGMPSEKLKNYMFRNNGDLTFEKVTDRWGLGYVSFSNGAAYADLDNDGDLDLVVNNIMDAAFIFENTISATNFLKIQLEGPPHNVDALGAKVEIYHDGRYQLQQKYHTRGYRSAMGGDIHFGLGNSEKSDSVKVTWPDGRQQVLSGAKANQAISFSHADARQKQTREIEKGKYFMDVTKKVRLDHLHRENEFDDFENQPLLPYKLSSRGPVLVVGDVNGDGLDDLFVGASVGYASAIYLQKASGEYFRKNQPAFFADIKYEDGGAAFFDLDNDGDLDLYVSSGGNEFPMNSANYQDRLYINDGSGKFTSSTNLIPGLTGSNSVVSPADFDGDGDIDLFVGGSLVPGRYPFPAPSYLLENIQGRLIDVTAERMPDLKEPGMVTTSVWTDYDTDGDMDLIIAGEWMPIMVFENHNGYFINVTERAGLGETAGWWQQIAVADFDGDGNMDLVAGNLGLNNKYKATPEAPFEVFAGDLDENGTHDIVLAYRQNDKLFPVRDRLTLIKQFPFIGEKFTTFESFARAEIKDIFSADMLEKSLHLTVNNFATAYFENTGDGKFIECPMPVEAQLSAVNTILPADVNGDGIPDIIIAGNIFEMEAETVRQDASYGLCMLGDGKGGFTSIPWKESGFSIDGNVKSGVLMNHGKGRILVFGKNGEYVQVVKITR